MPSTRPDTRIKFLQWLQSSLSLNAGQTFPFLVSSTIDPAQLANELKYILNYS